MPDRNGREIKSGDAASYLGDDPEGSFGVEVTVLEVRDHDHYLIRLDNPEPPPPEAAHASASYDAYRAMVSERNLEMQTPIEVHGETLVVHTD